MSSDSQQAHGIKRPHEATSASQPAAKKKKGDEPFNFSLLIIGCIVVLGVPVVGTTLREMTHIATKPSEPNTIDSRSRNCPYLDTINR